MKKKDLLIYLGLLIATLAFFFRFLDGQEVFAFKDLSRYFYPLRHLMAEQVLAGALPLWNPYIYFGTPLLAGLQIGFFYPLTIIHYILPFDLAFNYYIILHYFLAAVFTYLFVRHLGLSRAGAMISAVAFAFSGYLLSVSNMNTTLTSVVWLPLALLFWDRYLGIKREERPCLPAGREKEGEGGKKKAFFSPYFSIIFLILVLSLMFLGGEPTIIYVTGFVLFFWGIVFSKGKINKLKSVPVLLAAFLAVACLVGIQLLPFLELSALSNRVTMVQYKLVSMRSLPIREVIGFIFPYFYGNQIQAGNYSPMLLGEILQDWLLSPYLGMIPFVFLIFSFSGKLKKESIFFAIAGLVCLFMAFGSYTPFHYLLYRILPGIAVIRYPIKYIFLTIFAVSVMAGIGYDHVMGKDQLAKRCLAAFSLIFMLFGIGYTLSYHFRKEIFFFLKAKYAHLPPYFLAVLWHNLLFNINSLFFTAVVALCCAAVLFLRNRGILKNTAFGLAMVGILFFDLFSNNMSLNYPSSAEVYHKITPNLKAIGERGGISRIFYSAELEKHNRSVYGPDFDAALIESLDKLTSDRLVPYHLYDSFGYESIELQEYVDYFREFMYEKPFSRMNLIDLTDGKYLADLKPIRAAGLKLIGKQEYFYGKVYLYENPGSIPRPYLVGKYLVAGDKKAAFSAMADHRFDPKKVVVLSEDPKVKTGGSGGRAHLIVYRPNEVSVEAETESDGFMVLTDSYYPGWKATVDGKETKIYKADYMFRAVYLKAGKHSVRFIYDPLSLKIGAMFTALGILGLIGYAWYSIRKEKVNAA